MKNQLQTLLIIFATIVFFTACEKEETTNLLTISGEVLIEDALTPAITSPLEGSNVYLLNTPFTIDSITNWFTKTDILESTLTDANGLYTFSQIQVGNYTVMPVDTSAGYSFKWSENSDSILVSAGNTQTNYTINFTTPEPIVENAGRTGTFTDPRDNQTYTTIKIGKQTWFAENLNFETTNSWWYDNSSENGDYGRLYTWEAAKEACPSGWHLPTDDEWTELTDYLIDNGYGYGWNILLRNDIAKSMAATSGWKSNGNSYKSRCTIGNDPSINNSSGFTALAGGYRYTDGLFYNHGKYGSWWSSTEDEYLSSRAWYRRLYYNIANVGRFRESKMSAFSVRCLKD